jgi:hypothetical protein
VFGIQQLIQQQRMARQLAGDHRRRGAEANQVLQRAGEFAQQLQIGGAGDDPVNSGVMRQRHRRIGARADFAQQMRHQLIQHLAARADGAPSSSLRKSAISASTLRRSCRQDAPAPGWCHLLPAHPATARASTRPAAHPAIGFIIADQLVKHAPHVGFAASCALSVSQSSTCIPRPPGAVKFILRQGLRLLVVDALQQVFQRRRNR